MRDVLPLFVVPVSGKTGGRTRQGGVKGCSGAAQSKIRSDGIGRLDLFAL